MTTEAVIVSTARTGVGKAYRGALNNTDGPTLAGHVMAEAVTRAGISPGEDSSRNVTWLALMQFCQGENWHRNHHARPGIARLGWNWRQPDVGYLAICVLEKIGLATDVRHIRPDNPDHRTDQAA